MVKEHMTLIYRRILEMAMDCIGKFVASWSLQLAVIHSVTCGGVVRLGVADITHQKLLAR